VELIAQDAKGLFEDGFGNCEGNVTVNSQIQKLFRLPSKLDSAYPDIRTCDAPLHE